MPVPYVCPITIIMSPSLISKKPHSWHPDALQPSRELVKSNWTNLGGQYLEQILSSCWNAWMVPTNWPASASKAIDELDMARDKRKCKWDKPILERFPMSEYEEFRFCFLARHGSLPIPWVRAAGLLLSRGLVGDSSRLAFQRASSSSVVASFNNV